MRFNPGDYVLVPAFGNGANKAAFRPFKPMVGWQGPYEVTRAIAGSPTEFMVRLVGETREYPVHWRKMRRLGKTRSTKMRRLGGATLLVGATLPVGDLFL